MSGAPSTRAQARRVLWKAARPIVVVGAALALAMTGWSASRPAARRTTVALASYEQNSSLQPTGRRQRHARHHRVLVGQIPARLRTRQHVVALTFDAGADNGAAPKILSVLAKTGVTATFFMTGRWADLYPNWARRIARLYPIANHTYDHRDVLGLTLQQVRGEVLGAQSTIKRVIGHPPIALFRFPYGSSNASTLSVVNHLGYTAVGWTVDTLGWEGTSLGQSPQSVFARVLANLQPGEIVLMHAGANPIDHSTLDADALATIIRAIRARGFRFVALPQYF